jgi:hypothetical protein
MRERMSEWVLHWCSQSAPHKTQSAYHSLGLGDDLIPVRVSRRSQLTVALRQHARPIVIEDQELARPFARLLRVRERGLQALGEFIADTMSHAIGGPYGANIEAHWYVGRYVLPGNVQKVILKPKPYGAAGRPPRHLQA